MMSLCISQKFPPIRFTKDFFAKMTSGHNLTAIQRFYGKNYLSYHNHDCDINVEFKIDIKA